MTDPSKPITPGSVLAGLPQYEWSADASRDFEVALEGINLVVGRYVALIGDEEATGSPNHDAIRDWQAKVRQWTSRRRGLSVRDHEAVAATLRECAELLRTLRHGHG